MKLFSLLNTCKMEPNYFLAKDPTNPDLCDYILRLHPPISLIAVSNIEVHGTVFREDYICKMFSREGGTFQLTALQMNDGFSEFYLSIKEESERILNEAWEWYDKIGRPTVIIQP
jgi:hypothetical protein